jgi:NitT/TauT family transport system substrate-binding protein
MQRRQFLGWTTGGLIAAPALVGAQSAEEVGLRLNWLFNGQHTPFFLGRERGFYRAAGINLDIREGRGSGQSVQLIGARSDDFAIADSGSLIAGATRGVPIIAVMSHQNVSAFCITSLASNPIRTPADMVGKTIATTAGDAPTQLLPAILSAHGVDRARVSIASVDPAAKIRAVLEGRAQGLTGSTDEQPVRMEAMGHPTHSMMYADLGFNTVYFTIITHADTVRDRPDQIRRFLAATVRAWEAALAAPEEAVAALLRVKPDLDRDVLLAQLRVNLGLIHSPASRGQVIGWSAAEDWERTLGILREHRGIRTDWPATRFYSNAFLPQPGAPAG